MTYDDFTRPELEGNLATYEHLDKVPARGCPTHNTTGRPAAELAPRATLSRCAYVSEHGERCQRVPVIGFAGHCQMHGGDFAREFMGPGTPSELDRLRAENAALRAKLDRVVGVLDGLLAEVKET